MGRGEATSRDSGATQLRVAPAVTFRRQSITYPGTAILLESPGTEHWKSSGEFTARRECPGGKLVKFWLLCKSGLLLGVFRTCWRGSSFSGRLPDNFEDSKSSLHTWMLLGSRVPKIVAGLKLSQAGCLKSRSPERTDILECPKPFGWY